jgi:hypothetical protein
LRNTRQPIVSQRLFQHRVFGAFNIHLEDVRGFDLAQLHGATIILGNTYARKKREWLKKQLGSSALVLDATESAVMWENGRWVRFAQGR